MIYYNKNGKLVNYNCVKDKFDNGTQGNIFRVDDEICLKEYIDVPTNNTIFDDCGQRFTQDMFDYFKEDFNHPSFCKLYDLLYSELLYSENMATVVAYTMKYYEECIESILLFPTEYIVDNFSLIYDAVEKLTKDCIMAVDLNGRNIINTNNGMIVIDFDKYRMDTAMEYDTLSYVNKSALLYAFKGVFENALKRHGINVDNNPEIERILTNLFSFGTSPLVLKYRLRGFKRPIDMFNGM